MSGLRSVWLSALLTDRWVLASFVGTLMVFSIFLKGAMPGGGWPWLGVVAVLGFYIVLGAMVGKLGLETVAMWRRWRSGGCRFERVLSLALAGALVVIVGHLAAAGLIFGWALLKAFLGP